MYKIDNEIYRSGSENEGVLGELSVGMNPRQLEALSTTEGPLLIMAGAGSGKTRVVTHRIAYLIKGKYVQPWRILAITFTNKAAREMRERVGDLLGGAAQDVWISTFHAMCVRMLRRDAEKIGFTSNFSILDPAEQKSVLKGVIKRLNYDEKMISPKTAINKISDAKNNLVGVAEYKAIYGRQPIMEKYAAVYAGYQAELVRNNSMDFDDLIMNVIKLFKLHPEVLEHYQDKFDYIHVDEYQDTNDAQYNLVKSLADKKQNICVVGDADQSIYAWRGANMNNILNFEKDYPAAKVVLLEQNYRSTKNILDVANCVIKNNKKRKDKALWTDRVAGDKVVSMHVKDERDEGRFIIEKIQECLASGKHSLRDFAVLYRTNAQSRTVEEMLIKSNIPYRIVGGHKFYDRKEIKDIIAYLKVLVNPADSISLNRIINVPKRAIGATSVSKLNEFAAAYDESVYNIMANALPTGVSAKLANTLGALRATFENWKTKAQDLSLTETVQTLIKESGYEAELKRENTIESQARIENLEEFLSVTKEFDKRTDETVDGLERISDFLNDVSLMSEIDNVVDGQEVVLMTMHAAKGLEFPVVFIAGVEENIFPSGMALNENGQEGLEEERRLAYVGITRAERELYLLHAGTRMLYGRTQFNPPSRFISEIDRELLDAPGSSPSGIRIGKAKPVETKETKAKAEVDWAVGDIVVHKRFGEGEVIEVTADDMTELLVEFPDQGQKRLLAELAPISKK
ncbi:MAG: DNA helicase PcrA [Lactobacillales bacterium]|jgi:DNA helicase-2/ATP-dependent DNA helicase PcrA|nr:DNA helicase PcrA [Lactobacillales bacterium]